MKNAGDMIIPAIDVSTREEAMRLLEELEPYFRCFKIGLELMTGISGSQSVELIHSFGKDVFYDGKFKGIPATVAEASRNVRLKGVAMFTVDSCSGAAAMKAARAAVDTAIPVDETIVMERKILFTEPLTLASGILTSLNYDDLVEMGIMNKVNIADPQELARVQRENMEFLSVRNLAWLAQECQLDGVIASPQEVHAVREYCNPDFKVVTPGIRPPWAENNDQKRTRTPRQAILYGADYLVIGRPLTNPPQKIGRPRNAAELILEEVTQALQAVWQV